MPPTTAGSVLPDPAVRETITARLAELVDAVLAHPQMQPPNRNPTLYHVWDFAMRTKYIVSELENVEAGRPVQYPEQLPGYKKPSVEGKLKQTCMLLGVKKSETPPKARPTREKPRSCGQTS